MNAVAITYPQGRFNPAGVTRVLYAFAEDILTFPTLADSETALTFASLVEYDGPIVMKTGKQFFDLYCTLEEGEIKTGMAGPRDGKGFENTLEISFPGNDANFLGYKASLANRQVVFIVKEKNGIVRVVGSLEDPAYMETDDATSGKKIADGRKSIITFKDSKSTPAPIYKTALTSILTPAA
jgi:hypothetical protein